MAKNTAVNIDQSTKAPFVALIFSIILNFYLISFD